MRLHTLPCRPSDPSPRTHTIDFDALSADGLFLLHGDTGAGKSTLFAAVCFALYGKPPGDRDTAAAQPPRSRRPPDRSHPGGHPRRPPPAHPPDPRPDAPQAIRRRRDLPEGRNPPERMGRRRRRPGPLGTFQQVPPRGRRRDHRPAGHEPATSSARSSCCRRTSSPSSSAPTPTADEHSSAHSSAPAASPSSSAGSNDHSRTTEKNRDAARADVLRLAERIHQAAGPDLETQYTAPTPDDPHTLTEPARAWAQISSTPATPTTPGHSRQPQRPRRTCSGSRPSKPRPANSTSSRPPTPAPGSNSTCSSNRHSTRTHWSSAATRPAAPSRQPRCCTLRTPPQTTTPAPQCRTHRPRAPAARTQGPGRQPAGNRRAVSSRRSRRPDRPHPRRRHHPPADHRAATHRRRTAGLRHPATHRPGLARRSRTRPPPRLEARQEAARHAEEEARRHQSALNSLKTRLEAARRRDAHLADTAKAEAQLTDAQTATGLTGQDYLTIRRRRTEGMAAELAATLTDAPPARSADPAPTRHPPLPRTAAHTPGRTERRSPPRKGQGHPGNRRSRTARAPRTGCHRHR